MSMPNVLVQIDKVQFALERGRHTVEASEKGSALTKTTWSSLIKAALAADVEAGAAALAADLRAYLKTCYWHPDPADFTFTVVTSDVDDGRAWVPPSIYPCRSFPVAEPAPAR